MCGIAFVRGERDADKIVCEMLDRLAYRGPDGEGRYVDEGADAVLGHKRLAIIDPKGGAQPILTPDGDAALIANGMIYNDKGLRGDLLAHEPALVFRTGSDSEPILHGYRAYGTEIVRRLDGMFAFVLMAGGRVIAARDPIGIKPLYIGRRGDALYMASEIKALVGHVDTLEEFPPGHLFDDHADMERYYTVPEPRCELMDPEETAALVRDTLERAVVKRLRSDVPLGAFLSGGLDSSIIAALARRHLDTLHTYAVGLEGSEDLDASRRVAEHIGSKHHEYVIRPDELVRELPTILYHLESYDQDLVRSAAPTWFVARIASQSVKVVLTGEGADELFAGYAYYKKYADRSEMHRELHRSITTMHNINLQRVDRMTMAHGLEARVPFLDLEMIDLAMRIDPALKMHRTQTANIEKWILRHGFEDLLPDDIVWRDKAQFDQGSGTDVALAASMPRRSQVASSDVSPEEAWYRALFMDVFPKAEQALPLVAHWSSLRI